MDITCTSFIKTNICKRAKKSYAFIGPSEQLRGMKWEWVAGKLRRPCFTPLRWWRTYPVSGCSSQAWLPPGRRSCRWGRPLGCPPPQAGAAGASAPPWASPRIAPPWPLCAGASGGAPSGGGAPRPQRLPGQVLKGAERGPRRGRWRCGRSLLLLLHFCHRFSFIFLNVSFPIHKGKCMNVFSL